MEKYGKSFKELTRREKVQYLWEYYRWPAAGTILVTCFLVSFLTAIFTPQKVYSVDITINGKMAIDETRSEVEAQFEEQFDAGLNLGFMDWDNPGQLEMVMMQKIPMQIMAKELDILGLSTSAVESYLEQSGSEMFMPLDEYPEFAPLLEQYKDQLLVTGYDKNGTFEVVEGEQHVYGFKVNKIDNIPCVTLNEELTIGVTSTAKDIHKTVEMLTYLLEDKSN